MTKKQKSIRKKHIRMFGRNDVSRTRFLSQQEKLIFLQKLKQEVMKKIPPPEAITIPQEAITIGEAQPVIEGEIEDVKIYNRVLTETELQRNYERGLAKGANDDNQGS